MKHYLKPVERSFYAPILDFLKDMGFQGVSEIGIKSQKEYMDILFQYDEHQYIVEVKVSSKTEDMLEGIVQAYKYALNHGTKNTIIICYPNDVRNPVHAIESVNKIALDRSCRVVSLTEEWHENVDNITIKNYFSTLQSIIDRKHSSILKVETASKILEESIKLLSNLINKEFNDDKLFLEMLTYLTKDQGLFSSLCNLEKKSKKIQRNQVIDLLAYILVNQILFYFVYSGNVKSDKLKIDEFKTVDKIQDLHIYFNQIKKIDFKPIYDIDVISRIPSHSNIVGCVNNIIKCLSPLKVDDLRYDLFGRLIGKSMPKETRDILASYYTKTNSSEFIAKLLINKWDTKVWDLACGSGTLLVASYNRKKVLYENLKGGMLSKEDEKKLHKVFIEQQITGTDIMPFACHLTGLNLSAQNLYATTDFMRVCNKNSLEIDIEKDCEVEEAYGDMSNSLDKIQRKQKEIEDFNKDSPKPLPSTKSKTFKLEKVDTIIINPPFTPYNNIPNNFRDEFFRKELTNITGKRVGLWACFLVMADQLLIQGGKIGAIVHTNFLRGKFSKPIRDYFLDKYSIEYIIKPSRNSSFSEDTEITDIMLIAKKTPPDENHETKIILLKKPIDSYSVSDIDVDLVRNIETAITEKEENDHFTFIKIKQSELKEKRDNLACFMFGESQKNMDLINMVYKKICNSEKTIKMDFDKIQAGVQFRPEGESRKRVIARKYAESRIHRAKYYFTTDAKNGILEYFDKEGKSYNIEKSKITKTIRTLVGIDMLDASELYDYLIPNKGDTKEKANVIFAHKMRLNSDNSFLTSVYFEDKITPTNALSMYFTDDNDVAKILTMYFSSILYLIQFKRFDKATTVGMFEIGKEDMKQIYIPDFEKISKNQLDDMLIYFEEYKRKKFHPIKTQLENRLPERVELDRLFLKVLNIKFSDNELSDIYDVVHSEI